ncbi:MAG: hypothetical protein ICV77_07270 [Cyanobacteria bacterium Co-bin8]|nr:hypothetical protein [Cyanobacteria bacterium Co-bin8]
MFKSFALAAALALVLPAIPAQACEDANGNIIMIGGSCDSTAPAPTQARPAAQQGPTLRFSGLRIERESSAVPGQQHHYLTGTVTNASQHYATAALINFEVDTSPTALNPARVVASGIISSTAMSPDIIPPGGSATFRIYLAEELAGNGKDLRIVSGSWHLTDAAGRLVQMMQANFR